MRDQNEQLPDTFDRLPLRCRSHLDRQLGPRNAGAPRGNLNALKSAGYTDPLPSAELERLAYTLVSEPDHLPKIFAGIARDMHGRAGGQPLATVLLLRRLINQLPVHMADLQFVKELEYWVQRLPSEERPNFKLLIWQESMKLPYYARSMFLRKCAQKILQKTISGETITGTDPPDL